MYEDQDGYKYFLLLTDCFSLKLWCEPLKSKEASVVQKAFEKIFSEIQFPISEIQTDAGGEFKGNQKFFKENHILFKVKTGTKNKANYSEAGIYLVKKRLFMLMRSKLTTFWSKYLPDVVKALNERPLKRLGYLRPSDVSSPLDAVKVQEARRNHNIKVYEEPDWRTQEKNQKAYESDSKNVFQKGTFVYADDPQRPFKKSFHYQVRPKNYLFFYFISFFKVMKTYYYFTVIKVLRTIMLLEF